MLVVGDKSMQTGRDREPVLGRVDCRLKEPRPGQLAMRLGGEFEGAQYAGPPDRAAADGRVKESARLAVGIEEAVGRGRRRCRLAPIIGDDLVSARRPID